MAIYKDKLGPQGAVVMHVSNRHLELASVVVGIADANGPKSWVYDERSGRDSEYIFATNVVVSARAEADVGKLASTEQWAETDANANQRVWIGRECTCQKLALSLIPYANPYCTLTFINLADNPMRAYTLGPKGRLGSVHGISGSKFADKRT